LHSFEIKLFKCSLYFSGYVLAKDVTWFLRKYSYFPSYNIPFFLEISRMSGWDEKSKTNDWFKWGSCPRAKIFDRDHVKVVDIEQLQKLMRYNDYQHEPFSRCKCVPPYTAEASISTRGDLNPANGTYELEGMGHKNHGGLDFKVIICCPSVGVLDDGRNFKR
uniref:Phospholipase B-like n=1 Tax=Anisakis simplex TaxID=6269 RepID=A0A0M3IZJ6_ANISI